MSSQGEKMTLVLQGGGALGAYQAGAFEAMDEAGYQPQWIAGISIGAINAAIIAGNRPAKRVARLRAFWEGISAALPAANPFDSDIGRAFFNEASAGFAAAFGIPGFFVPRIPPPYFQPAGTPEALSFYDTAPLHDTLNDLVDFGYLNAPDGIRLSLGAVNIASGNFSYFDSEKDTLAPEHVIASGALPPGFPPVVIDDTAYWDGGIVSNTPLQYVLDENLGAHDDMCVFQVDLFSARGDLPQTMFDVVQRQKEIRFSSRTRLNTDVFKQTQTMRRAAHRLYAKLPPALQDDPDAHLLRDFACNAAITIVHLIHRPASHTSQSKDYEFSRLSVEEHWEAGRKDVRQTLSDPRWRDRHKPERAVTVFDLTRSET